MSTQVQKDARRVSRALKSQKKATVLLNRKGGTRSHAEAWLQMNGIPNEGDASLYISDAIERASIGDLNEAKRIVKMIKGEQQ